MEATICIFDMDDTLVDSWERLWECSLFLLDEAGIEYNEQEMISRIVPLGCRGTAELYHKMGVSGSVDELVARKEEKMEVFYRSRVHPKSGVIALLEQLKASGARMFVLSATPRHLVRLCLQSNNMEGFFEEIWSVDDFGTSKSDPMLFIRVAERLGVAPQRIHYFEDSMTALKNAKQAGFITYAVENHHTPKEIREMKEIHNGWIESFEAFTFEPERGESTACN